MRGWAVVAGAIVLAACGGSDGGGASSPSAPSVATLAVTLKEPSQTQDVKEGATKATFSFAAAYTGTPDGSVVPDVTFDKNVLSLDGDMAVAGQNITVKLSSAANLSAQNRTGEVTFRLCRDAACSVVYPGSTQTFRYTLNVGLLDWTTFQRTPAHTGYVHVTADPQKFAKAWEWKGAGVTAAYRPVAIAANTMVVTRTVRSTGSGFFNANTIVNAVDTGTGRQQWSYDMGGLYSASGPAVAGNQVSVTTVVQSSGANRVTTLDLSTGQFVRNMLFASQWSTFAQPTPIDKELYIASGYYGNMVYGYDLSDGATRWTAEGGGGKIWDGEALAADDKYVYYYSGNLDVFNRSDGSLVKSIVDPFFNWNGYTYHGGPVIGSRGNVITYSGSGMGTYPAALPLVSFDIAAGKYAWRTANSYNIVPALANGVLYAASNTLGQLDAISEETGKALWSWQLPAGEAFAANMVVLDNILLLSTDRRVYAVSLTDQHATLWSAPTPGYLAISPDAKLIVTPLSGDSSIIAYSLR